MKGYHFTGDKLRDGRPVPPIGEWLEHEGKIVLCESGLHASRHPFDALTYAPGNLLHRVIVKGDIVKGGDKFAGRHRKIVATIDAEDLLRKFARMCALDVIHLWDAPDVVVQYLRTGDEALRDAAWAAEWASPQGAAAWAAEWAAPSPATSVASWDAARAAAEDASRAAAWDAARAAQRRRFARMVREAFNAQT